MRYLGYTSWAVPVSLRNSRDLGFVTVSVTAFVAAVTQQEEVFVITFLAHLAILKYRGTYETVNLDIGLDIAPPCLPLS